MNYEKQQLLVIKEARKELVNLQATILAGMVDLAEGYDTAGYTLSLGLVGSLRCRVYNISPQTKKVCPDSFSLLE